MKRIALSALLLISLVACGGGVNKADAPPVGTIWFGESFNPTTLAITGRTTTVALGAPAVLVANVGKSMKPEDLKIRASFNGEVVNDQAVSGSGVGEYWGFPITSMPAAGDWLFELLDTGGTVLASGTITVT